MKSCLLVVALLVGTAVSAPLTAGDWNSQNVTIENKVKGFKAFLYVVAPDSWMTAFNAISEEGQKCLLKASSDPANKELYRTNNPENMKKDLQNRCPNDIKELSAFVDVMYQSFNALPEYFLQIFMELGKRMDADCKAFKDLTANKTAQTPDNFKALISQMSKDIAIFTDQLAKMSLEERKKISNAFPKLEAFLSGPNSDAFLNSLTQTYQVIGEGNFTSPEAREKFKSIIATWKLVFQDYLNANKESLKEAAKLFGKDLTQLQSMMAAQMNNAKPPQSANEMISQMNNVKMPQMGNGMNQRVEQGKEKLQEGKENLQGEKENLQDGKDRFQNWLQQARQNGQQTFSNWKSEAADRWNQFKEKASEIKARINNQQPSPSAQNAQS